MSNEAVEGLEAAIKYFNDNPQKHPNVDGYFNEILFAAERDLSRQQSAQRDSSTRTWNKNKDWPEDFPQENGCYANICCVCDEIFKGNKHRRVCKLCAAEGPCKDTAQSTGAGVDLEEAVGRAIVKEAWAIEGLPVKALTTGYRLLGRAAIDYLASQKLIVGGWRTIDSAPKDGTEIRFKNTQVGEDEILTCHWGEYISSWGKRYTDWNNGHLVCPTHWMPHILPSPPASTVKRGDT